MPDEYANYAFISYSHKDEKRAAWIQRKLEAYRLPSVIRKEAGSTVPERIRPVFRDATDLGVGRLRNNLQSELESSRFLIVVCSPNSARPNAEGKHWVNDEVTHFASLGRADRIVPVLVEGDEKTALCPKLRELGILAVDATKKSRARTLNDIVAALLGLRPDQLWLREDRRRRRRRLWCGLAAAVALVLTTLGGWRWYDVAATHVRYYSDYVDEWGIPTGIPSQLLTKEQVRNRLFSYRFEFKGRQKGGFFAPRILRRVVMIDATGRTYGQHCLSSMLDDPYYLRRPAIQMLRYHEDGTLESIEDQDRNGLPIVLHKFTGIRNEDVEHVRIMGGRELDAATANGTLDVSFNVFEDENNDMGTPPIQTIKTRITWYSHIRNERGHIVKTLFKQGREDSAIVSDADNTSGREFKLDDDGRVVRVVFLGIDGRPREDRTGIAGMERTFSPSGFGELRPSGQKNEAVPCGKLANWN